MSFVDEQLGRLIHVLEETGLIEDTDVIYTSDHGDMLGKFGMWWKCSLYEDSVRVPCIASGPSYRPGVELENVYEENAKKGRELEDELRAICSPEEENDRAHRFQERQLEMLRGE